MRRILSLALIALFAISARATEVANEIIRIATDATDLILSTAPNGRLYQVYLGPKLLHPEDFAKLSPYSRAGSDGSAATRGWEAYMTAGMARDEKGLQEAIKMLKDLKKEFWSNVFIPGSGDDQNTELEKALRVADFLEIGELMARDALNRAESCGGHFRVEHQKEEGEALRHDDKFMYVACWEYQGEDKDPVLLKEDLNYQFVTPQTRNYKK